MESAILILKCVIQEEMEKREKWRKKSEFSTIFSISPLSLFLLSYTSLSE